MEKIKTRHFGEVEAITNRLYYIIVEGKMIHATDTPDKFNTARYIARNMMICMGVEYSECNYEIREDGVRMHYVCEIVKK